MSSPNYTTETARDMTRQRLPNFIKAEYHTVFESKSPMSFTGRLWQWRGFEDQVRETFDAQRWGKSIISARLAQPDQNDISHEMFHCGDELSLSGRFVQNALHVMTAIGRDLNYKIHFGDYKTVYTQRGESVRLGHAKVASHAATQSKDGQTKPRSDVEKQPDFAALDDNHRARFVGEIKTPWTVDIKDLSRNESRFRRRLGECL